jgi:uncharacterized glyoxalase superfamily protein PhnB
MSVNIPVSNRGTTVVPVMRYRRLPEAIDWLCKAFGFEKHHVALADDGSILFAQLTLGRAMVMVGPIRASAFDKFLKQPDEVGGAETQVCYFFVPDAEAHCLNAKAAGARVIFDVVHSASRGRSYSCRDPEGHLWNFGTYDPWQCQVTTTSKWRLVSIPVMRATLAAALLVAVAAMMMPRGAPSNPNQDAADELAAVKTEREPATVTRSNDPAEEQTATVIVGTAAKATQQQLTELLQQKEALESAVTDLRQQWTQAVKQREQAEQVAKDLQKRLDRTWFGKMAAERTVRETQRQLKRERSEKTGLGHNTQTDQKQDKNPLFPLQ